MKFSTSSLTVLCAIFLTLILWASAFVGIRIGLQSYTPGDFALLRYFVASIIMGFIYFIYGKPRWLNFKECLQVIVVGLFGFTIYNIALNYGEISVAAGPASFIVGQMPIFVTILAIIFLNERLHLLGWIGFVISFSGIILIALGSSTDLHFNLGILAVLIATISASIYSIMQKSLLKTMNALELTTYAIWFGTLLMMVYLPSTLKQIHSAPLSATFAGIYLGIFPAAIAYLAWTYALSKMPAYKLANFLYYSPIFTTILAWLVLGEKPTMLCIAGGLIAILGTVLVAKQRQPVKQN